MTDAQVASTFVHAVRKRKPVRLVRFRRAFRAVPDHSTSSGLAIGEDGSIILDDSKGNQGGSISSSSQSSLAAAPSTTSDQPNRQTTPTVLLIPSSALSTKAQPLPQSSLVVYTSQDTPPPALSPSLATVVRSSLPGLPSAKPITEVPAPPSQFSSEMSAAPSIFFTTATLLPSRPATSVVATLTATQSELPVTYITSTGASVHPVTITTIVPVSGTDSQLSTTIVTLTTDAPRGAGKAITNGGSGTNSASGTAALPSGLPSSNPEYGLKVTHNPPLIIGLVLGSILLLSACAAGAGWILRARRRWQDHRIAALGIDTRTSFGNTSTLFVPDPTWYREESNESDGSMQHQGGMDTRRASISIGAEPSQNKGNRAVSGVGTFHRIAGDPFNDPSAPLRPDDINPYSYNYPSAMKYSYYSEPVSQYCHIPISAVPGRTSSMNAPLSLPVALSATGRFSRRGMFGTVSRLPTPALGERPCKELSGKWRKSMMGPAYRANTSQVRHSANPPTTSAIPDLERKAQSTPIGQVGTVDHNYERDRRSPLRVVGEPTKDAAADGRGSTVAAPTGSRVEEKLKRMREKRRELERT